MLPEEIRGLLKETDLFHGLEEAQLAEVSDLAAAETHAAGDLVVRQGEPSDSFSVVAAGAFDVYLYDEVLEVDRELTTLHRGDIFGDIGMLTAKDRTANVRATEAGTTLRFPRDRFLDFLRGHAGIALALAETLAERLDTSNRSRSTRMERMASFSPAADLVRKLPMPVIQRHKILPVALADNTVTFAMIEPSDLVARNTAATFLEEYTHDYVCVTRGDFEAFVKTRLPEILQAPVIQEEAPPIFFHRSEGSIVPPTESAAAQFFDKLLKTAIDAGASDLHFEPDPEGVNIRARIDGRMTELHPVTGFEIYTPMVARVKVIAELNLAERRLPQDASLRVGYRRRMLDMRVSTLPTPAGESVVCRLLDPTRRNLDLGELIVDPGVEEMVEDLFAYPSGLVLVTGPTGSGKTTTLYAGVRCRLEATPTIKLVTAEDPVEYELDGVSQVQVNTEIGLTFERILRSVLRQDPDVVLIGEMRDWESMAIALEAALTGHLVLSSLHTNNALETIMRLRQRGAESYVLASALRGVVSQRLVARLCAACSRPREVTDLDRQTLTALGLFKEGDEIKLYEGPGCDHCRSMGRRGRLGLYEVLVMTPELQGAIESGASFAEMQAVIPAASYLPMRRYAGKLLNRGLVAPEDIYPLFPSARLTETLKKNAG